tara:strand:+ start:256 stop:1377 length:1122 start_codon:yes stop_codon:yes gene_type:complete
MNCIRYFLSLSAFSLMLAFSCSALNGAEKKAKRPPPVVSPTIHADGSVTFRIKAPNAKAVSVSGEMIQGKTLPLTKSTDDIWSGTLESVEPGLYGYSLSVDGVKMIDPGNPQLKPMRSPKTSILHISGDHPFDFKEVPHGTVHYHGYQSEPINRFREMLVYTPPGYETGNESYPLLVLQHGHSDGATTWVTYGKAHWILDNLIAEGKAKPMIVVMLDGHPIPESYGEGRSQENTDELHRDLMQAALPMVETLYRIEPGRKNRAISGLSMGGLHALTIGLNELATFGTIGAFSAAVPADEDVLSALSNPKETNRQLDLLWFCIGEDDFLLEENKKFTAALDDAGIEYDWTLTDGGHSWPNWRDYLAEFAPLLFQ